MSEWLGLEASIPLQDHSLFDMFYMIGFAANSMFETPLHSQTSMTWYILQLYLS